jgi:hypothetical protein
VRAPIGRGGTGCGRVVEVRDGAVRARHGGKRLPLNRFGQALFSGETIIADEQEAWSPEGGLGRWSCPRLLPCPSVTLCTARRLAKLSRSFLAVQPPTTVPA